MKIIYAFKVFYILLEALKNSHSQKKLPFIETTLLNMTWALLPLDNCLY